MAITQNTYTGDGTTVLFTLTFPYLEGDDVKATINGVATTAFTFANASTVQFTVAPANGAAILLFRETDKDILSNRFFPNSSITSGSLNDNFTQGLYSIQELETFIGNQSTAGLQAQITTANTNASNAVVTANAASVTANGIAATANTALSNSTTALTTANAAFVSASSLSAYQTLAGMSAYLTTAAASSTYLTQSTATSTYLTQSTATSTYLTQSTATSTYLTQSAAASAALNYLSIYTHTTTATSKTLANRERCTVTAAGQTITLPSTPSAGWEVTVLIAGTFLDTIVDRNGTNIMSLAENMTIDKPDVSVTFYYVDATRGWRTI